MVLYFQLFLDSALVPLDFAKMDLCRAEIKHYAQTSSIFCLKSWTGTIPVSSFGIFQQSKILSQNS